MELSFVSSSFLETMNFASAIAKSVSAPCVISLVGDLGSGKTTFTKGLVAALGSQELVTSPTFTILNEFDQAVMPIKHFDLYRLNGFDEAKELGFDQIFSENDGLIVVEWAQNAPGLLPKKHLQISFEKLDDETRKIVVEDMQ